MRGRSLPWAVRVARFRRRLQHAVVRRLRGPGTTYVQQRVEEYRTYWSEATRRLGAEFRPLTENIWEVRRGEARVRLANYVTSADDPVTLRLAGDKGHCYRLAQQVGVPVPVHGIFGLGRLDDARAFVEEHGGLWTVKPVSGSASGLGVTTHLERWRQIREAALLASLYGPELLVERTVAAESCRLLYVGGELVHAVRRRGARVVGDGSASVGELATDAGIPMDVVTAATLRHEGLARDAVLPRGREQVLRSVPSDERSSSELRTVYDESITAEVAPPLAEAGRQIVRKLGTEFAGVDILTNDPTVSLAESGGVFLEVNTTPGIHHHYHTHEERAEHPVAVRVLEYLLERDAGRPRKAGSHER